jgi:hypothetical protein
MFETLRAKYIAAVLEIADYTAEVERLTDIVIAGHDTIAALRAELAALSLPTAAWRAARHAVMPGNQESSTAPMWAPFAFVNPRLVFQVCEPGHAHVTRFGARKLR